MKTNKNVYVCDRCGKQFQGYGGNANIFCSNQCYWDSKKKQIIKICIECGRKYKKPPSAHRSKFCSRECFHKHISRNSIDVPCKTCGKLIHKWQSQVYPSGNIYCSRQCATEAIKKPGWKETISFKLNSNIRGAIGKSLRGNKHGRHWEFLVGYTLADLKKHLERRFKKGMTWDNHGITGWHIDHKIPKTMFNFIKPEDDDFKKCWALKNLRPMWYKENIIKSNKIDKHFQPSLIFA